MIARIIAAPLDGHWSAWFDHAPNSPVEGRTAGEAVFRLLKVHGLDPKDIEADYRESRKGRPVFKVLNSSVCPDCGGSGKYVGLCVVEPCGSCGGTGIHVPF